MAADNQVKYQATVPIDRPVVDGDIVLLYYHFPNEYVGYQGPVGGFYMNGWWNMMNSSATSWGWVSSITNNGTAISITFSSDRDMDHVYATVIHTDISNIK